MVEIIDFRSAQASRVSPDLDGRIRQIIDKRIAAEPCTEQAEEELTPRERRRQERKLAPPATETCKNQRLREQRREVRRQAEAVTAYWRARLDFESAVGQAQRTGVPEGRRHPIVNSEDWLPMVGRWREAIVEQLLTPSPDVRAVNWKKAALAGDQHRYTDVKPGRIERAIANDLAFLAAHPTRRRKGEQS